MTARHLKLVVLAGLVVATVAGGALQRRAAAADTQPAAEATPAPQSQPPGLAAEQEEIAEQFRRFEAVLLRMAELTAPSDPRRAALLRQAVAESRKRGINGRLEALVKFLEENRLALAVTGQEEVQGDLGNLLELLLSENRHERLASEQARVREYLKRVNRLIKEQQSIQGQTFRNAEAGRMADRQGKLADETGELSEKIRQAEEGQPQGEPGEKDEEDKNSDDQPASGGRQPPEPNGDDQNPQQKPGEGRPQEGKPQEGKPQEGKPQEGDGAQPQQPQDGQPSQGENQGQNQGQGQGQGQNQNQDQQQNPARQRLDAAQQRMRQAQQRLDEAKRKEALDEQEQALRELEQAKAELEEILRQLREEEMARTLKLLEERFRAMLEAQLEIYEATGRLDRVPAEKRTRNDQIEAGRLSRREVELVLEADKALLVLREDATAVAMVEAVIEVRDDMQEVVERLAQGKVDQRTQGIEEDIIAALEEMIAALEKAQRDLEDQKGQPGQPGEPGEQPLIDILSELKMLRSLQVRVNRRTERYGALINGQEQAVEPDLIEALGELADRQERIQRATRHIVTGRNQ